MQSKSILIAIAALALSATGAQAFSGDVLEKAGLTDTQLAAFEEARELRAEGDKEGARDVLLDAGIDEQVIERVRSVLSEQRKAEHAAIEAAVAADDYDAFVAAIADSPLADIVTSPADFERFKEAFNLRKDGDHAAADVIFTELGVPAKPAHTNKHVKFTRTDSLSDEQKAAFTVARMANDREAMDAILDEAGFGHSERMSSPKRLRDGRELHDWK